MGHVPPGPVRFHGAGSHLQGRQHRGAPGEGAVAIPGSGGRRRELGDAGEQRAAEWYQARGYQVLDRNWRCREGELDLVVGDGRTLVFCEVKTRSGVRFGTPAEAVTPAKQARIRRLALRWLRERGGRGGPRPAVIRFDVATILGDQLDVLEAVF